MAAIPAQQQIPPVPVGLNLSAGGQQQYGQLVGQQATHAKLVEAKRILREEQHQATQPLHGLEAECDAAYVAVSSGQSLSAIQATLTQVQTTMTTMQTTMVAMQNTMTTMQNTMTTVQNTMATQASVDQLRTEFLVYKAGESR